MKVAARIAIGCLGVIVALVLVIAATFVSAMTAMKTNGAYREALGRIRSDSRVITAIGQPMNPAWLLRGNVSFNGNNGHVDLRFALHGSRGDADAYVVASREGNGPWTYEVLRVEPERGAAIDLASRMPR